MNLFQLKAFLLQSGLAGEFVVFIGVILITLSLVFVPKHAYGLSIWIAIFSLLGGFYFSGYTPGEGSYASFVFWPSVAYIKRFFFISGSVAFFGFLEWRFARNQALRPEPFIFLLLSIIGLCIMVQANSFFLLFLSAELFSICAYGLAKPQFSGENQAFSVVQYFGFGAIASAIGLFGLSLLVGFQSSLSIESEIAAYIPLIESIAALFFISFLLFKIGSVPFHFWIPKVYENAPTPFVGYISVAPKVAGVFAILWLITHTNADLTTPLMILVLLGVIIGNLAALQSERLKNLFAFSAISQASILLVPAIFYRQIPNSENQLLIYAISYGLVNQAAFCAIQYFENHLRDDLQINDLSGQFSIHPLPALLFIALLFSLVGIPPTIGFSAKLLMFSTLLPGLANWDSALGISVFSILVLSTLLSMAYFYKIPFQMIFKNKILESVNLRSSLSSLFWLFLIGLFVFLAFFKPLAFFMI